jgi:hypothetical protein
MDFHDHVQIDAGGLVTGRDGSDARLWVRLGAGKASDPQHRQAGQDQAGNASLPDRSSYASRRMRDALTFRH